MRFQLLHTRVPALALAAAMTLTACSEEPTAGGRAPGQAVPIELEISSRTAMAGSQVAVAVRVDASAGAVGGILGALTYDASRLRYIGQSAEGSAITIVNDKQAGELRFTTFNQAGISGRVARFVFETRAGRYADALAYVHESAVSAGRNLHKVDVRVGDEPVVTAVAIPRDARRMTVSDWMATVGGGSLGAPISQRPGEYRLNLAYGDVDFDGSVGLFDYLGVANAAVGNDQIIIGTDGPSDVDLVIAGNVFPAGAAGACGTEFDGSRVLDLFDYLSIANEVVGVNEACVGDVIPGRGPVATTVQSLTATSVPNLVIDSLEVTTLTNDRIWQLEGILDVKAGGQLIIQPGTIVQGNTAAGTTVAIFVQRGGQIVANGTQNQPITFTCTANPKVKGCWGGIFIAGKARVNLGQALGTPPYGCLQRQGEGNGPLYGGCDDADNSGSLKYALIEYAGKIVGANNELNGLTLGAVGSATTIDFVQIHAGQDDGIEFFGGSVNVKHLVLTGNDDDQFDFSFGWKGDAQFVITQADQGDLTALDSKAIEADNTEPAPGTADQPRTSPRLWNFTLIGNLATAQDDGAIHLRRGTGPSMSNFLIIGFPIGMDIDDAPTCTVFAAGPDAGTPPSIQSSTFIDVPNLGNNDGSDPAGAGCPGVVSATEGEEDFINAVASNRTRAGVANVLFDGLNTNLPDWRLLPGANESAPNPPAGSIFSPAAYRGAVAPAGSFGDIPWYSGWTRPFASATTP